MYNKAIQPGQLQGAYVALMTPFCFLTEKQERSKGFVQKSVDYQKLDMLIEDLVKTGIGIVACGTTAQSATLSHGEQICLANHIFDRVKGRVPFIVGAGSNNTEESIDMALGISERIGPTTFLMATGYYNKPPQEGAVAHYKAIAKELEKSKSNLVLYNVPGRTVFDLKPESVAELAKVPNIIGIKEATTDLSRFEYLVQNTDPSKFSVLSGEDSIVADVMRVGGRGVISASANIAPKYFLGITKLAMHGFHDEAKKETKFATSSKVPALPNGIESFV